MRSGLEHALGYLLTEHAVVEPARVLSVHDPFRQDADGLEGDQHLSGVPRRTRDDGQDLDHDRIFRELHVRGFRNCGDQAQPESPVFAHVYEEIESSEILFLVRPLEAQAQSQITRRHRAPPFAVRLSKGGI